MEDDFPQLCLVVTLCIQQLKNTFYMHHGRTSAKTAENRFSFQIIFAFVVDGGFSEWTMFGNCSVSCGVGFRHRSRECNNPAPQHGGKNCQGASSETEDCHIEHCAGSKLKVFNMSS